jgi:hypothetical protein
MDKEWNLLNFQSNWTEQHMYLRGPFEKFVAAMRRCYAEGGGDRYAKL